MLRLGSLGYITFKVVRDMRSLPKKRILLFRKDIKIIVNI